MASRIAGIALRGGAALLALDLTSALALALLGLAGIAYRPVPSAALSLPQQEAVARVIAGTTQYIAVDRDLGWTIRPRGASGLYHANAQGLRGREDAAPDPAPGVVRVAAFGDSFTHGDEVGDNETWETRLAAQIPRVEVLNFGVPGYGPDQAWLRYQRDAAAFHPKIVLLGLVTDDLPRLVNTFVPFRDPQTGMPLARPRFTAAGDLIPCGLPDSASYRALIDAPGPTLARLGARDAYYQAGPRAHAWDALAAVRLLRLALARPLDTSEEASSILRILLARWAEAATAAGQRFAVLRLPQRDELSHPRPPDALDAWLSARGVAAIDAGEALPVGSDPGAWFGPTHYTAEGNARIAALIGEDLMRWGWLSRPAGGPVP